MYSVEKRTVLFRSPLHAVYEILNATNYNESLQINLNLAEKSIRIVYKCSEQLLE